MTRSQTIAAALALYILTGVYIVRADEQAVVRRFGGVVAERVPPGLHVGLPWGIERVDRLKVREQKRLEVGFELPDAALGRAAAPGRREYFTGDENLVNIELLVQYTIRDPRNYLFQSANLTDLLRRAAEASVTEAVATRPVDSLLTTGKLEVQEELRRLIQQRVDEYALGVAVTAVSIQGVTPPVKVADAFRQVASAREDRDRIIKEAESYANATLPAAEGEAAKMGEDAIAYRDQRVLQARGDADRFTQAYEAYRLSPDVTRARLYLEAMEEILPRIKIVHMDRSGRTPVDLNILPKTGGAPSAPPAPSGAAAGTTPPSAVPAPKQ